MLRPSLPNLTIMAHTYTSCLFHCVSSTKQRINLIRDPQALWRYIAGIGKAKNIVVTAAGGTANHLHLLVDLHPMIPLAKAMQEIKGNSSRWLNETSRPFAWQEGYAALSVSRSQRATVIGYIDNQEEHHRKRSFEDEFLALLQKSGISYDPQYVFG